jgi:aspartyl-tRNA(Asn)/glutamyl-tRNA(Gln) amidotransferase subunit B
LQHVVIDGKKVTLVDYNRSGVPLVEIVTEPDIHSGDQAKEFLKKLQQIIRYLEISSADMEKGSMRLEPNISVTPTTKDGKIHLPDYKVEVKNINSFNFVKRAIDFEVERHIQLLESGKKPAQETRGYVESSSSTVSQRSKEDAVDYRYFSEPDIPPIQIAASWIEEIKKSIPELPDMRMERFVTEYGIGAQEAMALVDTKEQAEYFESCVSLAQANDRYKAISIKRIANTMINTHIDKNMVSPSALLDEFLKETAAKDVDGTVLDEAIVSVLKEQPKAVDEYKKGKVTVIMFLVGQVKRALQGKGDAQLIKQALEEKMRTNG